MGAEKPCSHGLFLVRDHGYGPDPGTACRCGHDRGWHAGCPYSVKHCLVEFDDGRCSCNAFEAREPATIADLDAMDEGERVSWIRSHYCVHCGRKLGPDEYCHCWNDE